MRRSSLCYSAPWHTPWGCAVRVGLHGRGNRTVPRCTLAVTHLLSSGLTFSATDANGSGVIGYSQKGQGTGSSLLVLEAAKEEQVQHCTSCLLPFAALGIPCSVPTLSGLTVIVKEKCDSAITVKGRY